MGQVGRQYEERLDQRDQQHEDHDVGNDPQQLQGARREEQERDEGDDGGQNAHAYGPGHPSRTQNRGIQGVPAPLALGGDVLTDHHRIVHDDADQHEQGENRQHVQGQVRGPEEQQRADERNGDAEGDPEGDAQVEHDHEADEHQHHACESVLHNGQQKVCDWAGAIGPHLDRHVLRHGIVHKGVLDDLHNFASRLADRRVDLNQHGGDAVHSQHQILIDESIVDFSDITEPHDGAIQSRDERDVEELLADAALGQRLQNHAAGAGAQLAGSQVHRALAHNPGNLGEGQAVAAQSLFAYLDSDLAIARALQADQRHRRQRQQVVAQLFGGKPQLVLCEHGGRNRQRHHVAHGPRQRHLRLLGTDRREVLDAVHGVLNVVEHGLGIGKGGNFDVDLAEPLGGDPHDALHAGIADDALLDPAVDVLLHLFGRCARRGDVNRDRAVVNAGKTPHGQLAAGDGAADQQDEHEEVGGDPVFRKVAN